jgi:hypothetical protein
VTGGRRRSTSGQTFGLPIPDEEAEKMSTVGQVVEYLRGGGARKGSGK